MCRVIHAVKERNLLPIALHFHVLAINYQRTTEAFPVAVTSGYIVVVGKKFQLFHDPRIRSVQAFADAMSKRAYARSLEVEIEQRFCVFPAVVDAEPCFAIVTLIPSVPVSCSPLLCGEAPALFACRMAYRSAFL